MTTSTNMDSRGDEASRGEDVCIDASEVGWGSIPSDVPNAPACVEECETQFLRRRVPEYDGNDLVPVCERLLDGKSADKDPSLWELYCCNSAVCGVLISDASEEFRHSPSARNIINRCHNLGFLSVQDPGLPPPTYICPAVATSHTENGLPCQKRESSASNPVKTTNLPTGTRETRVPSARHTPTSTLSDSEAAGVNQEDDEQLGNKGSTGLSAGDKAAVAICSVVGIIAILGLLFWCFRRKRFDHRYLRDVRRRFKLHGPQSTGSPISVLLPTGTVPRQPATPLTPPPRLKERKLLPTILVPGRPAPASEDRSFSISARSYRPAPRGGGGHSSRSSSLGGSRSDGAFYKGRPLPKVHETLLPTLSHHVTAAGKTASLSSSASNRTTTTLRTSTTTNSVAPVPAAASLALTPPVSPRRPQRPHEAPLEIPDLVRPGPDRGHGPGPGPPPNRALPPAPPLASASASTVSLALTQNQGQHQQQPSAQVHGDSGADTGIANSNPAQEVALQQESQDFREHTERYGREPRGSWGSWGGSGGGAPGVVSMSPQKAGGGGGASMNSPVLEEADLERMGGRYRGI
ncbi:hypothetical protein SODALDRAFT_348199 [Sodiomyces alkalinus F11]|uniref:Uncharacterized protein n=1 Tax=Sodiomyces alkalinus (strain CBS 110278 / VKM F-3762 / F11) TaxID=1314773 RepID=A0A3N2Q9V1_SODAK|nr:hypothetical protein SODALDRAFT_348199 [Sodiomyces alkalinus F11]ROT43487.1 hypothetical protein SODALDRAFT_348199 [Sodiomyces alkalinus F11]